MIGKLLAGAAFAVMSIGAFLLTLAVGVITFMVMAGAGIIALVTFGIVGYRKSKKAPMPAPVPPDEL